MMKRFKLLGTNLGKHAMEGQNMSFYFSHEFSHTRKQEGKIVTGYRRRQLATFKWTVGSEIIDASLNLIKTKLGSVLVTKTLWHWKVSCKAHSQVPRKLERWNQCKNLFYLFWDELPIFLEFSLSLRGFGVGFNTGINMGLTMNSYCSITLLNWQLSHHRCPSLCWCTGRLSTTWSQVINPFSFY